VTVQSIQGVIKQLRDSGISVLITDHAAREILGTVDRCYVIYQGQVLIDGSPEEVKEHPKVRQEYLGDLDAAASSPSQRARNESQHLDESQHVPAPPGARNPGHPAVPRPHFRDPGDQVRKSTRSVTDV